MVALGFRLYGIGITPDGRRLYVVGNCPRDVVEFGLGMIAVVDTATLTVETFSATFGASCGLNQIVISPDGRRGYIADNLTDAITIIDTDPLSPTVNQVIDTIPTGGGRLGDIDLTPDGRLALVTVRAASGELRVVDVDPGSASFGTVIGRTSVKFPTAVVHAGLPGAFAYVASRGCLDAACSVEEAGNVVVIEGLPPP
jgi:DNA-binding beta-propeller fold protein YncE